MHNTIPMPAAHTPSTLGQGFNNTLAISSALALLGRCSTAAAESGVGVALHRYLSVPV